MTLECEGSSNYYYLFWSRSKNSRPILTGGQNLTKITRLILLDLVSSSLLTTTTPRSIVLE